MTARPLVERWTPGTPPGPRLHQAWQAGRSCTVRITGADVLRVSTSAAARTLAVLEERGIPLGPVMENRARACIEFTVPAGTAATWPPLPRTHCVAEALIRCPAPDTTTHPYRTAGRRAWISPPAPAAPSVTDADALCEAVTSALIQLAEQPPRTPTYRPGEGRS
ncbi:hypothetical protein ACFRAO_43100 [Streptomyces sp. NPDC056656]|uniref:hypothetical protein n=1 Tax=Streptomyces sp. NPDC056656 TaxID=3345895 RepID=UPI003686EFE0